MERGEFSYYAAIMGSAIAFVGGVSWGAGEIAKSNYDSRDAQEYVEQNGYTDVQLEDTDTMFIGVRGCGESDNVKYEFSATSPSGADVGVIACKGLFKGATLRQG